MHKLKRKLNRHTKIPISILKKLPGNVAEFLFSEFLGLQPLTLLCYYD